MIDFDYWASLYKIDPDQFNRRKNQLLKEAANKLGQAKMLARIKDQDKILEAVKDPVSRHKILVKLFDDYIAKSAIKIKEHLDKD